MVLAEIYLSLSEVLLGSSEEEEVRLLEVALDAETVAVHDSEPIVGLAVALQFSDAGSIK